MGKCPETHRPAAQLTHWQGNCLKQDRKVKTHTQRLSFGLYVCMPASPHTTKYTYTHIHILQTYTHTKKRNQPNHQFKNYKWYTIYRALTASRAYRLELTLQDLREGVSSEYEGLGHYLIPQ